MTYFEQLARLPCKDQVAEKHHSLKISKVVTMARMQCALGVLGVARE